jgi:pSer/pThr/pTyr-binding forkhead associated (FHA) protein
VVIEGPRLGHFVHLGEVPTVIGRAASADFHVDHPSVSRRHCTVWEDALGAGVRDLDSKNGTASTARRYGARRWRMATTCASATWC